MKFLHRSGCNIHQINSFGCNAVLWCAQGRASVETMAWLLQSGADFNLVNTNGHSAFHKAAQRGIREVVEWLTDKFLVNKVDEEACWSFIGPDADGHCPSDLCHMEGYAELAIWISNMEFHCVIQSIGSLATSVEDLLNKPQSMGIPVWLAQDLLKAKGLCIMDDICHGVRRLTLNLMAHFTPSPVILLHGVSNENVAKTLINDID